MLSGAMTHKVEFSILMRKNVAPVDALNPTGKAHWRTSDHGVLDVEVYRSPSAWPASVEDLFNFAEQERIGMGSAWYQNLASNGLPADSCVRFYVLSRNHVPVAALPVLIHNVPRRAVSALASFYTTLFAPALAGTEGTPALTRLIQAVIAGNGPLQRLEFAPMDPLGRAMGCLRAALKANGMVTFDYFCHGNWFLPVNCDWSSYLQQREGGVRSTVRRMERKLMAERARVEIISDPLDVERCIAAFDHVYGRSWKRPEPYPGFMPGLIRLCAARGWLRLGLVSLAGQAIAVQLWIVANGRAEVYKLAYDESFKAFAPGTVLTACLLQHVLEVDKVSEVDYLIGDDSYKAQWMTQRRERWGLLAFNPRTAAGLLGCLRESAGRVLKAARTWLLGLRAKMLA